MCGSRRSARRPPVRELGPASNATGPASESSQGAPSGTRSSSRQALSPSGTLARRSGLAPSSSLSPWLAGSSGPVRASPMVSERPSSNASPARTSQLARPRARGWTHTRSMRYFPGRRADAALAVCFPKSRLGFLHVLLHVLLKSTRASCVLSCEAPPRCRCRPMPSTSATREERLPKARCCLGAHESRSRAPLFLLQAVSHPRAGSPSKSFFRRGGCVYPSHARSSPPRCSFRCSGLGLPLGVVPTALLHRDPIRCRRMLRCPVTRGAHCAGWPSSSSALSLSSCICKARWPVLRVC